MVNFNLQVWFRPKITHVKVILYENLKEKNISTYDSYRQIALMKAIQDLWVVPIKNPYHFEAEIHEFHSCFKQKQPPALFVTCYEEINSDPTRKKTMNIPVRFRTKFLGKLHTITPDPVGSSTWSDMKVKFVMDI